MSRDLSSWNRCFHVEVLYTGCLKGLHDFFFSVNAWCLNPLRCQLSLLCKSESDFMNLEGLLNIYKRERQRERIKNQAYRRKQKKQIIHVHTLNHNHRNYLCKKLSFASSICNVPPFHLDLFNTVMPAYKERKSHLF